MKNKHAFSRGFTLIELMIVIVILGILMATILPRLTGAQSRTRDTARKADLGNIAQALEVYNGENGSYPSAKTGICLSPAATSTDTDADKVTSYELGVNMKGKKVPTAASKKQKTLGKCEGMYYYQSLSSGGVDATSYVLATTVENWKMGNLEVVSTATVLETDADKISLKTPSAKATGKAYLYAVMP